MQQQGLSGVHLLFGSAADARALQGLGWATREQPQFHWQREPLWRAGLADAEASRQEWRLGLAYASEKPVINAGFTYGDRKGGLGFVLPISVWQWRLRNESSGDRLGRDASLQPQRLVSEGRARIEGQKRGTRYVAVRQGGHG